MFPCYIPSFPSTAVLFHKDMLLFVAGLLKFYQLLTVVYFVVACAFAPRLHQTLSKGGPMQLVIQLLTVSVFLQAVGAFLMVVHLSR